MGKIAKGVNKINFTILYGHYCYINIENFSQKFSPCVFRHSVIKRVGRSLSYGKSKTAISFLKI